MTEENQNQAPENKPENQKNDVIEVEVYGVAVKLPVEDARKLVEKRDKNSAGYKELSDKLKSYEQEKNELARKLEFETRAKAGAYAEAENIVAEKYKGQISKYHQKVIETDIKNVLSTIPEYLNDDRSDCTDMLIMIAVYEDYDRMRILIMTGL